MDAQDHGTVPGLAAPVLAHHHPVDLAPLGTATAAAVVTSINEKAPDTPHVGGPMQIKTHIDIVRQAFNPGKPAAALLCQAGDRHG